MTGNSCKVILPCEMVKLVLINAAANHIARSDRCLPNHELANIFQMLSLSSWFTLQTELSKWQTNSLVILSRCTTFKPKLWSWINPHCLVLTVIVVVLLLDCPDYNNPSHPLHLSRHYSHPLKEKSSPSEKYSENQYKRSH